MAVVAQGTARRPRSLTADLAVVGRALLIYFSVFTLATVQFLRHSLPSPDMVHVPLDVVTWGFELLILAPTVLFAAVDFVLAKSDASGKRVRGFRIAVFSVALILMLRQLQLYFGLAGSLFAIAADFHAEAVLFVALSACIVYATVRWYDGFRQFFQIAAPFAFIIAAVAFFQMAPERYPDSGYAAETPAGNAANAPVFLIVMDELSFDLVDDGAAIDAGRYPNLSSLAGDSAWFTNATTNYVHTSLILPEMMESTLNVTDEYQVRLYGQYSYVESLAWNHCAIDITCRGANHLSLDAKPELFGTVMRRSLYQATPTFADKLLTPLTGWMTGGLDSPPPHVDHLGVHTFTNRQFDELLGDIDGETARGTISFYHQLLPHKPMVFNADGSHTNDPGGINGDNAYAAQMEFADGLLGELIAKLKGEGIYDESVILLTGDHGRRPWTTIENLQPVEESALDLTDLTAHVPLLIHGPAVTAGRYDVDYQHMDFEATLMDVIGAETSETEGVSAFASERPERDKVFFLDINNEVYWVYVRDEETGAWNITEFVHGPLGYYHRIGEEPEGEPAPAAD